MVKFTRRVGTCFLLLFSFLAISIGAAPAQASLVYDLNATSRIPASMTDFSLRYDDVDGNGRFTLNELVSFSGLTYYPPGSPSVDFTTIVTVPQYNSGTSPYTGGSLTSWSFSDGPPISNILSQNPGTWSYTQTAAPVPIPAAAWLLGTGLIGIVALKRRFQR